jgi:hypothetical protein
MPGKFFMFRQFTMQSYFVVYTDQQSDRETGYNLQTPGTTETKTFLHHSKGDSREDGEDADRWKLSCSDTSRK